MDPLRVVLAVLPFAAIAVTIGTLLTFVHRARRRLASETVRSTSVLRAGPVCLFGEIVAAGDGPATALTITQVRTRMGWRERARTVTCRPFEIRTAAGSVVVDIDALALHTEGLVRTPERGDARECITQILPGDRVVASGTLVRGEGDGAYRQSVRWALVPRDGRVLISSVPRGTLDRALVRWHRSTRRWLVVLGLVGVGSLGFLALRDAIAVATLPLGLVLITWHVFRDEVLPWWARPRLDDPRAARPASR